MGQSAAQLRLQSDLKYISQEPPEGKHSLIGAPHCPVKLLGADKLDRAELI